MVVHKTDTKFSIYFKYDLKKIFIITYNFGIYKKNLKSNKKVAEFLECIIFGCVYRRNIGRWYRMIWICRERKKQHQQQRRQRQRQQQQQPTKHSISNSHYLLRLQALTHLYIHRNQCTATAFKTIWMEHSLSFTSLILGPSLSVCVRVWVCFSI